LNAKEMIKNLSEVISVRGSDNCKIQSIVGDSRKVEPGSLFVAIPGLGVDGHDFIPEALNRGAVAIVGERDINLRDKLYVQVKNSRKALAQCSASFYGYPSEQLKIIGITGTNGKTTITYLIQAMLKKIGAKTGVIGTIGNIIDDVKLPAKFTTPEAPKLHELFSDMLKYHVEYVVMEVSSHSLKLHRVDGINFDLGIFTNLTQDHLDFHHSFKDYLISKRKLFEQSKAAVTNIDDAYGRAILDAINIPVITYGRHEDAKIKAKNVKLTSEGVFYDLVFQGKSFQVFYGVPGLFSVYNSLAALAAGITLHLPIDSMISALSEVKGVPGRFEPVKCGQNFTLVVDYSHTPDSLKNAIQTARDFCEGKIITVFGCGGDRDREKRSMMGKIASEMSDFVVVTSDNPRSEDPESILDDIEKGISGTNYERVLDRRQAIKTAVEKARKGDIVIIAGKGHENYQILKDKIIHFDDREVAKELLMGVEEK